MPVPTKITFRDFPPSDAVSARITERAEKLGSFHKRITECRVTVESPHKHHRKGKLYKINVVLIVPGGELVVNNATHDNQAHEDIYVAIRDAFNAMQRRLEDHVRVRGGKVKAHETPATHGKVAKLFHDYGFIEDSLGGEVYFHCNSVAGDGFERLEVGEEVRLTVAEDESDKGPQATVVTPTGKRRPTEAANKE